MSCKINTCFLMQSMLSSLMSFFKSEEAVPEMDTHWISESGIIDVFVLLGPKPHDVFQQYATLTGTTPIPPVRFKMFTLNKPCFTQQNILAS